MYVLYLFSRVSEQSNSNLMPYCRGNEGPTVSEAGSLKSRCQQGACSERSGVESFLAILSSWWLPAMPSIPWPVDPSSSFSLCYRMELSLLLHIFSSSEVTITGKSLPYFSDFIISVISATP